MPLLDVLEVLRSRASRRHESTAEAVWAAAKRLAAGESADPAGIESAMAETGMTIEGFDELVELAKKRRDWFDAVDRATPARVKRDKLLMTAAAERESYEQTRRRWLERAEALDAEIATLNRVVRAGDDARDALCTPSHLPPAAAEKLNDAIAEHQAALGRVESLQRQVNEQREIRERRTWLAAQKREAGKHHPLDIDDEERFAKRAANKIAELEPQLRDAQSEARVAEGQVAKVRAAALKT